MSDEKIQQKTCQLIEMVSGFCDENLDDEYKKLCIRLVEKLAKKYDVPFKRGKLEIWACSIICAVGQLNFLFDYPTEPYVSQDFLCGYFKSRRSTVTVKARDIRRMLKLKLGDEEFSTEFVLSLNIPESDEDLKRIRQLDEVKFLLSQKCPLKVNDVENHELLDLIDKNSDDVYYLLKSSYFLCFYSQNSMMLLKDDSGKFMIPIFTSANVCSELMGTFNVLPRIWPFSNIINYIDNEKFGGVVINYGTDDFFISKEMIGIVYPDFDKIDYWHIFFAR